MPAGALGPALSCPWVFGPLCLSFPSVRQDGLPVWGLRGASSEMACAERSELVRLPPCSSPSSPSVQPRGRGKKGPPGWQPSKDRGKPLCHPPCLVPTSLDRLMGGGGAVGVGSPSLLAPLIPREKQDCLPGELPLRTDATQPRQAQTRVGTAHYRLHGRAPRAPPWCAHHTSQFAWKGPESPALVCPPHFTVFTFP